MVGNVSWGEDTLVEGVEHVEGSEKCIGVLFVRKKRCKCIPRLPQG